MFMTSSSKDRSKSSTRLNWRPTSPSCTSRRSPSTPAPSERSVHSSCRWDSTSPLLSPLQPLPERSTRSHFQRKSSATSKSVTSASTTTMDTSESVPPQPSSHHLSHLPLQIPSKQAPSASKTELALFSSGNSTTSTPLKTPNGPSTTQS